MEMKAFLCHSSKNSAFVVEVAKHLERNLDGIYYYEDYQRSDESFFKTISKALQECSVMVIFVGQAKLSKYQQLEVERALALHEKNPQETRHFFIVLLPGQDDIPTELGLLTGFPRLKVNSLTSREAYKIAEKIVNDGLKLPWHSITKKILLSTLSRRRV